MKYEIRQLKKYKNVFFPRFDRYKENLIKLDKLVLIKFSKDTMVVPVETQWFGFYKLGQTKEILAYNETALYIEDWIGLKTLDEAGKLKFHYNQGGHLEFTDGFFHKLVRKYFVNV